MPRRPRTATGGLVYHVLNRGVARQNVFDDEGDFAAFERVMAEALGREPGVRLLGYCLMSNHWHLVLWPKRDGDPYKSLSLEATKAQATLSMAADR
jgi:putative transposase